MVFDAHSRAFAFFHGEPGRGILRQHEDGGRRSGARATQAEGLGRRRPLDGQGSLGGADRRSRGRGGALPKQSATGPLRRRHPRHPGTPPRPRAGGNDPDPVALRLRHAPIADCARCDRLRRAS